MEEKEKREEKTATREKEGNVKEYSGNHHNGVIGTWKERKGWGRRESNGEGSKRENRGRNSGKGRATDDKFKWSQANEWGKLDWNNKKMRKDLKKLMKKIAKQEKKITGSKMQETIEGEWKAETRKKEGRERVKRKLRKKMKIILFI